MNYTLTGPCKDCPFRTDVTPYLTPGRTDGILESLVDRGESFECHKTIDHDEEGEPIPTSNSQHCAGALILLEKIGRPNQMMRIAYRLGLYDPDKLKMDSPVYETPAAMKKAYKKARA